MSLSLQTKNVSKAFGSCQALSDVSVSFAPGKIHALLGENGAGKSTLMKVLFGLYPPTSGQTLLNGQPVQWRSSREAIANGIGMVQQHFTLVDSLSAIDNILLGSEVTMTCGILQRQRAIEQLEAQLPSPQLAVPWHTLVSELTVGQRQRIEILKLLFRRAQLLILDEPTAVLTPKEVLDFFKVLGQLRDEGRTILLITHKINEVLQVCDTYTVLRAGRFVTSGEVAHTSPDKIVASMIGRQMPEFVVDRSPVSGPSILEMKEVRAGQKGDLGFSLKVQRGEIVGVAGIEGSGQTELVESILGLRAFAGEIRLLDHVLPPFAAAQVRELGLGLIPEDRLQQGLWLEESCFANMAIGLEDQFVEHGMFNQKRLRATTSAWAQDYDVRAANLEVSVGSLSGGNQQKLIFAREVSGRRPQFLLCHQPTRGVDLGATDLIQRRLIHLRNEGLGILMLSSDLDELLKICDRLYVLFQGRVVAEFPRSQFDRMQIGSAMTGVSQ